MDVKRLLHPETLSHKEIIDVLESLCIKLPEDVTREKALEIFRKVAMPLPQRSRNISNDSNVRQLNELTISNGFKRDQNETLNNAKKMRLNHNNFDETKDMHQIKYQLNDIRIDERPCSPVILPEISCRKVQLKRTHLFQKASDEETKRIKLK